MIKSFDGHDYINIYVEEAAGCRITTFKYENRPWSIDDPQEVLFTVGFETNIKETERIHMLIDHGEREQQVSFGWALVGQPILALHSYDNPGDHTITIYCFGKLAERAAKDGQPAITAQGWLDLSSQVKLGERKYDHFSGYDYPPDPYKPFNPQIDVPNTWHDTYGKAWVNKGDWFDLDDNPLAAHITAVTNLSYFTDILKVGTDNKDYWSVSQARGSITTPLNGIQTLGLASGSISDFTTNESYFIMKHNGKQISVPLTEPRTNKRYQYEIILPFGDMADSDVLEYTDVNNYGKLSPEPILGRCPCLVYKFKLCQCCLCAL